jgi:caa(3)-type oxidase subunit IV
MSEENQNQGDDDPHDGGHQVNYAKIYVTLLILFAISVLGPFIGEITGITLITLITAFGIAFVKANLVIQNFMHLRWEKKIMKWVLMASLVVMALFVAGVAPDVYNHEGDNWENLAAKAAVARGIPGGEHDAEEEHEEEEPAVEVVSAGFNAAGSYAMICAACHGATGSGDGAAGVLLDPSPANFTDPTFWPTRDDARIKTVIRDGGVAVGASALMAPWGALYDDEQLDAMVEYVKLFNPGGE